MAVGEDDPGALGRSAVKVISTSLARSGSVSICHCRLMSQLKHDAVRRVVGQYPGPAALAAVDAAVDDVAADERLEHHLRERRVEQVLVVVPPGADLGGEDVECAGDRGIDLDRGADDGGVRGGHRFPWGCRAAFLERGK